MPNPEKKPVVLAILDGWGHSTQTTGNPVSQAALPTLASITNQYPLVLLQASGPAVGMSWGEIGNSEVGHLAIGAGRIIPQYHFRINHAIDDGSFFTNPALLGAFQHAAQNHSRVHLVGLLTSNTVHSALVHLIALLKLAAQQNQIEVYLHLFLDGRDSGLHEAPLLLSKVSEALRSIGVGKIATVIGRDYAMDRDNNWQLTGPAYDLIASAQGTSSSDLTETIKANYEKGLTDSNMPALVTNGYAGLQENDALLFFNFREDSMRQLLRVFVESDFSLFERKAIGGLYIATMTQYLESQKQPAAFSPPDLKNSLAEYLSKQGKTQLHIAETDKYAHVTYFFNGFKNASWPGETDVFIDSVKDIQANPAMGANETAQRISAALDQDQYDFVVANFANADLLAHSGNLNATIKGLEAVDRAVAVLQAKVLAKNGILLVTADHGNAESMLYRTGGETETRHDDNPVFFILIGNDYRQTKDIMRVEEEKAEVRGILPDIAPTILELMGLPKVEEMTGQSLLPILLKK